MRGLLCFAQRRKMQETTLASIAPKNCRGTRNVRYDLPGGLKAERLFIGQLQLNQAVPVGAAHVCFGSNPAV
jgi:hypothetical protein